MDVENGIVSFDFIYDCWKNQSYPDDFNELLEKYLYNKADIFGTANVREVTSWLKKILVAIEIGISRDEERFGKHKEFWKNILGREWKVSVEDRWVEWA